jgi:hypothetical protein
MALTDTFVKNIKPTAAADGDKHTDGQGLYLHVKQAGKYWRVSYRFDGKQKLLAMGVYPPQAPQALGLLLIVGMVLPYLRSSLVDGQSDLAPRIRNHRRAQ